MILINNSNQGFVISWRFAVDGQPVTFDDNLNPTLRHAKNGASPARILTKKQLA
jgi:hypothetical protein